MNKVLHSKCIIEIKHIYLARMFSSRIYIRMDLAQKGFDLRPNPREHHTFESKNILLHSTRFRPILIQHQTSEMSEIKGMNKYQEVGQSFPPSLLVVLAEI